MRAAVVVLAAGSGSRVGAEVNKVLLPLDGVPVVARSVRTACRVPGVRRVVLVVRDGEQEAVRAAVEPELFPSPGPGPHEEPRVEMVTGGETRHASEWQALALLADDIGAGKIDLVAMHDGARPLANADLYARVFAAASEHGGAIPVAPLDHLVDVDGAALPDRLVGVQTPQAFGATALLAAHRAARADGFEATDTAGCLAAYGAGAVVGVPSDADNLKLTVADDFRVAAALTAR